MLFGIDIDQQAVAWTIRLLLLTVWEASVAPSPARRLAPDGPHPPETPLCQPTRRKIPVPSETGGMRQAIDQAGQSWRDAERWRVAVPQTDSQSTRAPRLDEEKPLATNRLEALVHALLGQP